MQPGDIMQVIMVLQVVTVLQVYTVQSFIMAKKFRKLGLATVMMHTGQSLPVAVKTTHLAAVLTEQKPSVTKQK